VIDQPVRASLRCTGSGMPQGFFEEGGDGAMPVVAYLAQRPLLSFAWEGMYWPRVAGWQSVHTSQGDRTWWYAWSPGDWRALHRIERMRETGRWIAGVGNGKAKNKGMEEVQEQVGKEWFYLLVLLSCLFLWVERKI